MPPSQDPYFDELFRANATAVHRYFARRAAPSDVEDLAAEVFATAWRRRADIPAGAELPWLYRTAAYLLANHRRKLRPVLVDTIDHADPNGAAFADAALTDNDVQWAVGSEDIAAVLDGLSDRDRRILLLSAWEGLQGNELAVALGISRTAADTALSRARSRLRDAWDALDRT